MAKGFGIASLLVAILGIIVPAVTIWVIWLALILATITALLGDKAFPIASFFTCLTNIVFLSPLTWALLFGESKGEGSFFKITTIALFIAPIVALIIGVAVRKKPANVSH